MTKINKQNFTRIILSNAPIILLFISVLNEFDFNNLGLKYFSFNFTFILIFYCGLRKNMTLGYGLIFLAGLINDAITNLPMGLSSLSYLLICVSASYLKTITLRPSLLKDLIYFLVTILVVNSLSYIFLPIIFFISVEYTYLLTNTFFTFLLYFVFAHLFRFYEKMIFGRFDV